MATQENALYCQSSKIVAENTLSDLEKDIYGDIPITSLMDTYCKANIINASSVHSLDDRSSTPSLAFPPSKNSAISQNYPRNRVGTYSKLNPKYCEVPSIEKSGSMARQQSTPVVVSNKFYMEMNDIPKTSADRESKFKISSLNSHTKQSAETNTCLYRAQHRFIPRHSDELDLIEGDLLELIKIHPDLWFEGYNQRTQEYGLVPYRYVSLVNKAVSDSDIYQARETFRASFLGSVESSSPSGRSAVEQAMKLILLARRNQCANTAQPVVVEVTTLGVTIHIIEPEITKSNSQPIFFSMYRVSYGSIQGSRTFAIIAKEEHTNTFICYAYETEVAAKKVLSIFSQAFKQFYNLVATTNNTQ